LQVLLPIYGPLLFLSFANFLPPRFYCFLPRRFFFSFADTSSLLCGESYNNRFLLLKPILYGFFPDIPGVLFFLPICDEGLFYQSRILVFSFHLPGNNFQRSFSAFRFPSFLEPPPLFLVIRFLRVFASLHPNPFNLFGFFC